MKKNTINAVELKGISKKYVIHHEKPTLVEKITGTKNNIFYALKNINLTIQKGERLGIIGLNGSGKTTLLKIIVGITSPTNGSVNVSGRVVSLIDLEAGFHPDLTGIQNIYLNGMLLGMSKEEISSKLKSIISFADIGDFINTPLFTYSQGMKLRLGFSVAIHSDPEIFILDENISVGDKDFSNNSNIKINEMIKKGKTIIVASHDLDFIETTCKRVIWIDSKKIKADSTAKNVIAQYKKYAAK